MYLNGNVISGEFDETNNAFSLQKVKQFTTETTINAKQLNALYDYLKKHSGDSDGHVITLYDQLPIKLTSEEINLLLKDLEKIETYYS